jgi:hypothetical protein
LFAQVTDQDRFEIFPLSESRFFYKVVDAEIEFIRDNKDRIDRLVLYQSGMELPARRIT